MDIESGLIRILSKGAGEFGPLEPAEFGGDGGKP